MISIIPFLNDNLCRPFLYLHRKQHPLRYLDDLELFESFILHLLKQQPCEKVDVSEPHEPSDGDLQRVREFDNSLEIEICILVQQNVKCN